MGGDARREEGGGRREERGKGAVAALTVSGPRATRTRRGVGRGSSASPDPPREQDGSEDEAAAAAYGSSSCRVSVREEARHLSRLWRRGWPRGRPQDGPGDPAPGRWACARLPVSRGFDSAWRCGRSVQGLARPPRTAKERGSGREPGLACAPKLKG